MDRLNSSPGGRAALFVVLFGMANMGYALGQSHGVPRILDLDSAAFVALQERINGSPAMRVRLGRTYRELHRPIISDEAITYGPWTDRDTIVASDVLEMQIRRGRSSTTGAMAGGFGLGTMSMAAGFVAMRDCGFDILCDSVGDVAVLTVIGAAFGALAGGFIGGVVDLVRSDW